jgi:outer membrane receptor protein involved in Fe transport
LGTNAQALYSRESVLSGGPTWGVLFSYGVRAGNDYRSGGDDPFPVPSSYKKWDMLCKTSVDLGRHSRIELDCLRTEMNGVELPGVAYDLENSTNDQFSLRYIAQEDPEGPRQFVLQSWWNGTRYRGDALRPSKQASLYYSFFTLPNYFEDQINTDGRGRLESLGVRALRTFGAADTPQWTVGADWRRYRQWYEEIDLDSAGQVVFGGNIFGIPHSQMDDAGVLTDLALPLSERLSVNVGGRVDQTWAAVDAADRIITQIDDPADYFYVPGVNQPSFTLGMAYVAARYKLSDEHTLRAGTGFAMRSPDLGELYSDEPYVPYLRFGNTFLDGLSTLKPEKTLQLDLGLTYESKRTSWGIRGFYAMIRDYILPVPAFIDPSAPDFILAPRVLGRDFYAFPADWRTDIGTVNENADTNQAGYQYVNLSLATLLGGDLYGEHKLLDWLSVYGAMSYTRGTNTSPVAFLETPDQYGPDGQKIPLGGSEGLPGIYPLNGTLAVRVFEPEQDRWLVEFAARMVRAQDHLATSLSEIGTPGFTTFALRGYYRVNKNVRLRVDLDNLLDRYYAEPGSLAIIGPAGLPVFVPEPGFTAIFGLDARF